MNKRVLKFNFISVFVALLLMMIISFFSIYQNNIDQSKKQIENYLAVVVSLYENDDTYQTSPESLKTYTSALDENLRLTIISTQGEVLFDSDSDTTENHNDRAEFLSQNKVFIRYSYTLQKRMMYIASKPTNAPVIIRLALPLGDINKNNFFFWIILLEVLLVYVVVVFLSTLYYKHALKPFIESLNALATLTGSPKNYAVDDPKLLALQVDEIKATLDKQLHQIEADHHQLKTILDGMKTGVLVLDGQKVIHANKMVVTYFNLNNKVTLELFVQTILKDRLNDHSFIESIDKKDYLFEIVSYQSKWLENGYIISITDITDELKLEKTKKEFFQNASHELKSPLTVIKGNLELITEGIIKDDIDETLQKAITEIDRLNALVNQMLDVSILETKALNQPKTYPIKDYIEKIIEDYKPKMLEKKLDLHLKLDDSTAYIEDNHLVMLLTNLIDNAIKYNKKHGKLIIDLTHQKLIIQDTGLGIDKQSINRIYERFFRAGDEAVKRISGSGLGLAIVKHIAATYQIKITLQSEPDKGTTFTLIFPK